MDNYVSFSTPTLPNLAAYHKSCLKRTDAETVFKLILLQFFCRDSLESLGPVDVDKTRSKYKRDRGRTQTAGQKF